ncbi:hypothetical protein HG536_0B05060 [Torulaspora globosa]|uniref:DNA-directed RNA polymerase III subunit RPC4 n=1 Tax=Torulaspora globosa TaxID=48254 RepID=A0A7G3ZDQ6_9SACH|nr:uncharacterized protein HG536_0B05060 [Torulaspora globosa]QLL31642.1 hypothetical protein HG536_0B05060 [Torulaspora globosa]
MSSGSGSGRLPSLNSSSGKPSLKFKPKAVARRTKEEREASAPKIKTEEISRPYNDKKNNQGRSTATANKQRRMQRFLSNTHVISSGPLAAGNFVSEKGSDMRRGFIKTEGGTSSLVHSGLQNIEGGEANSDDDDLDHKDKEHGAKNKSKFNMGREYAVHDIDGEDEDEENSDEIGEMDEEALQARRVEELFPVRPLRIRHEDIEVVEKKVQESISDATTREATPAVKTEEGVANGTELQQALEQKQANLQDRLKELSLESQFQSLDQSETLQEMKALINDHLLIGKKLNKINNKPGRFILFQLPSKLPEFEEVTPKAEQEPATDTKEESHEADKGAHKSKMKDEPAKLSEDSLIGKIGSIRVHRSGKLSVKIGNVVMDISKGADAAFLQDVVAINESGETPCLENLGRIDGRVVITPRF